jgi:cytochrome c556
MNRLFQTCFLALMAMRRQFRILCAVGFATMVVLQSAYGDDKDVVDYREHVMNTLNEQSGAVGQILSGAVPDDNLVAHLDAIALTASIALKAFQPKVLGGEAKPDVWANWSDFAKRMNEFAQKTALTAKAAKEPGRSGVSEMIIEALSCKACHDTYRHEKQEKK